MWERIRVIVKKEFRQTFREPRMRMMVILPPIIFKDGQTMTICGVVTSVIKRFRK